MVSKQNTSFNFQVTFFPFLLADGGFDTAYNESTPLDFPIVWTIQKSTFNFEENLKPEKGQFCIYIVSNNRFIFKIFI